MKEAYQVQSAALSDQGRKRSNNEDWVAFFEPNDSGELLASGCLYIVADGVGGAAKGERASQYAAQKVLYEYYRLPQLHPGERLQQVMRQVGNEIHAYARENTISGRMATTLVAAVIKERTLTVANVGDSRAYLIRNGEVKQITRDHSRGGELVRSGVMTEEQARQARGKNALTRSLGGELDVQVDVFTEIPLQPDDIVLLCSDGLTRYARPDEIARLAAQAPVAEIARGLVNLANQRGGADNISVAVVQINQLVNVSDTAPPEPRGQMPTPVELDTVIPILTSRSQLPSWMASVPREYLALGVAGLFVVVVFTILGTAFVINWIRGIGIPPTAIATVLASDTPAITSTLGLTQTGLGGASTPFPTQLITATQATLPAVTATTVLVSPNSPSSTLTTAPVGFCVLDVVYGDTLLALESKFGVDIVRYYTECTPEQTGMSCSGGNDIAVTGAIIDLWYLVLPEFSEEDCGDPPFYWATEDMTDQ